MMINDFMMIDGVIFDYGGTLDSRGVHWSEVLWDGFLAAYGGGFDAARVTKEQFREAYVHAERALARERIILPQDDFATLLLKKVRIEVAYMADQRWLPAGHVDADALAAFVAAYCDSRARECIDEARPVLETLSRRVPLMLVSNFYGNIDSVLRGYGIRDYFKGIIESAVVGVRKPNPTLFRLGVDALELPPDRVLVVGDSLRKDILPAESLGCQVLWLKGKGWTADEDAQTHPCQIASITEVLNCWSPLIPS